MKTLSDMQRLMVQDYIQCMRAWGDKARSLHSVAAEYDTRVSDVERAVREAKAAGLKVSDFNCTREELVKK